MEGDLLTLLDLARGPQLGAVEDAGVRVARVVGEADVVLDLEADPGVLVLLQPAPLRYRRGKVESFYPSDALPAAKLSTHKSQHP